MSDQNAIPEIPEGLAAIAIPQKPSDLAALIDHTLLKPEATADQIDALCREAAEHHFCSVCVNSTWVPRAEVLLRDTSVRVCTVAGFPLGAMASAAKQFEARKAIEDGAVEIDMVLNIGALKSGDLETAESDIRLVREVCTNGVVLKVIIENALLTQEEKVSSSRIVKAAGADFVKTSTGFSHHGATVEDVILMRQTVGPGMGVKAAGGVRSFEDAVNMVRAGATRIGTSSGVKLVAGEGGGTSY